MPNRFIRYSSFSRLLIAALLLFVAVACNRKIAFNNSTVVPAAEGYVKVKKDKNNNRAIEVSVRNLAEAKRLASPQNLYVVWIETPEGVKNLGQLKTGTGLLSNTLKASLETVTPYKPTRLFITAENDASIQYPGAQVVLSTSSF